MIHAVNPPHRADPRNADHTPKSLIDSPGSASDNRISASCIHLLSRVHYLFNDEFTFIQTIKNFAFQFNLDR